MGDLVVVDPCAQRAVVVEDRGAALDADRVLRPGQKARPVVAVERVLLAGGDVDLQAVPRALLREDAGDLGLELAVAAQPASRVPGAVADVDVAARLADLRGDALHAGDLAVVEIAGEREVEPDAVEVHAPIDLRALGLGHRGEHVIDAELLHDLGDQVRAQEVVLRQRHGHAAEPAQRGAAPAQPRRPVGPPAVGRQVGGVQDDDVPADPPRPARARPGARRG